MLQRHPLLARARPGRQPAVREAGLHGQADRARTWSGWRPRAPTSRRWRGGSTPASPSCRPRAPSPSSSPPRRATRPPTRPSRRRRLRLHQEYEVEKIRRDVRITTIYEGTSEIMQWTIVPRPLAHPPAGARRLLPKHGGVARRPAPRGPAGRCRRGGAGGARRARDHRALPRRPAHAPPARALPARRADDPRRDRGQLRALRRRPRRGEVRALLRAQGGQGDVADLRPRGRARHRRPGPCAWCAAWTRSTTAMAELERGARRRARIHAVGQGAASPTSTWWPRQSSSRTRPSRSEPRSRHEMPLGRP